MQARAAEKRVLHLLFPRQDMFPALGMGVSISAESRALGVAPWRARSFPVCAPPRCADARRGSATTAGWPSSPRHFAEKILHVRARLDHQRSAQLSVQRMLDHHVQHPHAVIHQNLQLLLGSLRSDACRPASRGAPTFARPANGSLAAPKVSLRRPRAEWPRPAPGIAGSRGNAAPMRCRARAAPCVRIHSIRRRRRFAPA